MNKEMQLFIYKLILIYGEQPIIGTICANSAAEAVQRLEEEYGRSVVDSYGIKPLRDDIMNFTMDMPIEGSATGKRIEFNYDPTLEEDFDTNYTETFVQEVDEDDGPIVYQIECPNCGRTLYFDSIDVEEKHPINCPQCGCYIKNIELTDNEDEENDES